MIKLYDKKSPMLMPTGVTMTADELRASGRYDMLFSKDCVVEIGSSGTFRSFQPLDNLKDAFGINEPDPAKAFELVLAAQEEERQKAQSEQITLENIQAQLDALTGAN